MKKLPILLISIILCADNLKAIQVEWTEDAIHGFNFTITGSGLPYDRTETNDSMSLQYYGMENEHIESPSKTWEMWISLSGVVIGAPDFSETWSINIGRVTNVWRNLQYGDEVMGLLYGNTLTSDQFASFADGLYEVTGTYTPEFKEWKPIMTTSFTSSDYWNPSTWEWSINSVGRAPGSPAGVPDGGSSAVMLGLAMAGIIMFRKITHPSNL